MSLYNMIHGVNPLAGALLAALNLSPGDVGRFRDCFLARENDAEDGELQIHIYTRNGGGNRDDYEGVTDALRAHPEYIGDSDDYFDCTYATYRFRVPEQLRDMLAALVAADPAAVPSSPQERFQDFLEALRTKPEDPTVQRVTEAMRPVFEKIAEAAK